MTQTQYTALVAGAHQYWGLTEQDVINALTAKFGAGYNLGAIALNQARITVADFAMNARDVYDAPTVVEASTTIEAPPADPALEDDLQ